MDKKQLKRQSLKNFAAAAFIFFVLGSISLGALKCAPPVERIAAETAEIP